ncbi:MAG: hypothetical protein GVY08_15065 [Bacteroidetes bacterium]|jgi:hypothetical protein|nr:hypothetical protein [Bacteroidota bacterium]
MKSFKDRSLSGKFFIPILYLISGLFSGIIYNQPVEAESSCPQTACNGDDCEFFGNMTRCVFDHPTSSDCNSAIPCNPSPVED